MTPRKRETVAALARNSFINIGVTGAIANVGKVENRTKMAWLQITTSFHVKLQLSGSALLLDGFGTSTSCDLGASAI